ncbi:hypothetical protein [Nocardioides pacificus]
MARRFITKTEIDQIADRGETVLEVDPRTTVTDLAREQAQQRGVSIRRVEAVDGPASPGSDPPVRARVRSAVIARLGEVPGDLDAVIDRVMRG